MKQKTQRGSSRGGHTSEGEVLSRSNGLSYAVAHCGANVLYYGTTRVWSSTMQQPQLTGYADIGEVRMEVQAASCNQLLADGWVLLGIYPLTRVGEMAQATRQNGQQQKQSQDPQRYIWRLVGYVVGKRREL
jgi:hypothetical protein